MVSEIQSVIFNKSSWTKASSAKELKNMNLKPLKAAHETTDKIHYRIHDPKKYSRLRTKKLSAKHMELVMGFF